VLMLWEANQVHCSRCFTLMVTWHVETRHNQDTR